MTKYDNFNPAIPDSEDITRIENLPPVNEEVLSPTYKKSDKGEKMRRQKVQVRKKNKENNGKSFAEKVKEWANGQTPRWITGLFLGFFGVYLGVSFLSYFVTCVSDQAEILNSPIGQSGIIANSGGEGGARISEFLINGCFGLGSFVIVFWLLAMAVKLLVGRPRFKSVDFTIKSMVALITVSLIIGLITITMQSPVNWGGYHGRYVNEFVVHFLGWTGALILCFFMISLFVVICLRDFINWIIRIRRKRAEKKRIAAEKEALRREKEREIEEMRRFEQVDQGNLPESDIDNNEGEDDAHVTFGDEETGLYSSLPDFDEEEEESPLDIKVDTVEVPLPDQESLDGYVLDDNEKENHGDSVTPDSLAETSNKSNIESEENDSDVVENNSGDPMVVTVNTISQTEVSRTAYDGVLPGMHPYKFPPAELLREGKEKISVDAIEQKENKDKIEKTLLDFGIPIQSIQATVGPTVTLYEIVPDNGVRINKIRNLVDDIALSLSAVGVRIIAPIPGKGTVGIEVANNDPQTVSMRTVIKSRKYQESTYKLPIALGSTISNDVYIADLAKMPHLLVAGATGQGKSVGLNAIIASLLYRKTPDELKFVMVDPKMVEFSLYAKLEKHYLAKIPDSEDAIITDMDKVVATLSSLCGNGRQVSVA